MSGLVSIFTDSMMPFLLFAYANSININPPRTPAPVPMALPADPYFACSVVPAANGLASMYAAIILTAAFTSCSMIWDIDVGTMVL